MDRLVIAIVAGVVAACGSSQAAPEPDAQPQPARYQGQPVTYWISQLDDLDRATRIQALEAIRLFGPEAAPAIPKLQLMVATTDTRIRDGATNALVGIGEPALPVLLQLALTDRDIMARVAIGRALTRSRIADTAVDSLIVYLDSEDIAVRLAALATLEAMKARAYRATPKLIELLKDEAMPSWNNQISAAAGRILSEIGPPALSALQAELNDPDLAYRRRIVYILVAMGLHALPTLMDALETQPDSVAVYVVTMVAGNGPLGSIGAERAAEAVIVALQSDSPAVRREAASRLGTMGPDRALAWDALIEATRDAETDIQWLALDALNNIATEPGRHDLQWERFRFKPPPNVTAIPVGEFVRFHNGRTGPHQVVFQPGDHDQSALDALMNGMPDNTGLTGPVVDAHGAVYTVSFADVPPGTYRFTCGRHPSEAGRVHVVPSSF